MNTYITHGTCSRKIEFDIEENVLKKVNFKNGCKGNLQGISKLVEGMTVYEVINRLKGIQCQGVTSCPDQLARALEEYIQNRRSE